MNPQSTSPNESDKVKSTVDDDSTREGNASPDTQEPSPKPMSSRLRNVGKDESVSLDSKPARRQQHVTFTSQNEAVEPSNNQRFTLPMAGSEDMESSLAQTDGMSPMQQTESQDPITMGSNLHNLDNSNGTFTSSGEVEYGDLDSRVKPMQERAARLARINAGSRSAPGSATNSPDTTPPTSPGPKRTTGTLEVPGGSLNHEQFSEKQKPLVPDLPEDIANEVKNLVRQHTKRIGGTLHYTAQSDGDVTIPSGAITPSAEQHEDYVKPPDHYRGGVLSSLLKLYNQEPRGQMEQKDPKRPKTHSRHTSWGGPSRNSSPTSSGYNTPKWYKSPQSLSTASLLATTSAQLAAHGTSGSGTHTPKRPKIKGRSTSGGIMSKFQRTEDEMRITVHIAETLQRQRYILRLCRALMVFGAPTHRLEEYLKMTARILEIDGQFLYMPGCMVVSFGDASTHTSDMQLVRVAQALDLGKLQATHLIYKEVIHDIVSVEDGISRLEELLKKPPRYKPWILVLIYGLASAAVGPLFSARWIDLPICFILGSILGFLALIVAPKSDLYTNVFEIVAAVLTSFLARAFGSITDHHGNRIFCFSAMAQASIALILPGYIILCGALELQSKNIVAGSVRMFYALIYSLLLGFGITIGTALYGAMDSNATSSTECSNVLNHYWKFLFVPPFTLCLLVVNQAEWNQAPMMIIISLIGYTVNFFASERFTSSVEVANALGALAVGVVGNLYSRVSHHIAFTAMLPAIFVQVPSGLAAQGSLISGLQTADSIANHTSGSTSSELSDQYNSTLANLAVGMIRVAIGISVGLFFAAIVVYPFGKRRSGLFSF